MYGQMQIPNLTNFLLFSPHNKGDYRPPLESNSLIIRLTEGCDNGGRCRFCVYTDRSTEGFRFRENSVDEIRLNIQKAAEHYRQWLSLLDKYRERQNCSDSASYLISKLKNQWCQKVFFQEANALFCKTDKLKEVMTMVKEYFPHIKTFSSFGSARVLGNERHPRYKPVSELEDLRKNGLELIYMGLESGADAVLSFMRKEANSHHMILAGKNIKEAGIRLCISFILGLGGTDKSQTHAEQTATVLNQIKPDMVAGLSLFIAENTPLYQAMKDKEFVPATIEQIVEEKEYILRHIEFPCWYSSNHIANILNEVTGEIPRDREFMLERIQKYRSLSIKQKLLFILGSRDHYYPTLDHLLRENFERVYRIMMANLNIRLHQVERDWKNNTAYQHEHKETPNDENGISYLRSWERLSELLQDPALDFPDKVLMIRLWEKNSDLLEQKDFFSPRFLEEVYGKASTLFTPKYM